MKKVLVCDDDEAILDVIKIVLEGDNYKVETASSIRKIFEKVKIFSPNLILLDLTMPNINVKKTIVTLKKQLKDIPIILVSGIGHLEKKTKKFQASDFLEKPFEIDELLRIVKKYTKGG